jgi:hypothetical protein
MRKFGVMLLLVCGCVIGASREANAQATDRGYVNVGFGVEWGESDLSDTKNFTIYDEAARINQATHWSSGSIFDIGAGIRVWRGLTVGVAYHQETNTADTALDGSIPSPVFFNRPRSFTATAPGLFRREHGTHLQFGWLFPYGEKLDVLAFAGPSWFRLQQDVVSDVTVGEKGSPFTEVVVQPTTTTRERSVVGFNLGADVTYIVWSNDRVRVGAGSFLRFTQASADVLLMSTEQPTDVGGFQFGFGGRLRF